MAYRIVPKLPLDAEFQRIAGEQIDKAHVALAGDPANPQSIAVARRRLKKLRGLLRLMRPALGEKAFRTENWRWRDCGRLLSAHRDASAAVDAIAGLAAMDRDNGADLAALLTLLKARRDQIEFEGGGARSDVDRVLQDLDRGLKQLSSSPPDPMTPGPMTPAQATAAMGMVYRRAAAGYRQAVAEPDIAAFHEWRKAVKYHWMHLQLIRSVWPAPMKARAEKCKQLADILGDANDLAVLEALVASDPSVAMGIEDIGALETHIRAARVDLFNQALVLGKALFARDAKWFTERIAVMWAGGPDNR